MGGVVKPFNMKPSKIRRKAKRQAERIEAARRAEALASYANRIKRVDALILSRGYANSASKSEVEAMPLAPIAV